MAAKKISLPGQLSTAFERLYKQKFDPKQGGGGWHLWQVVLGVPLESAEFTKRLAIIQAGCERLLSELSEFPTDDDISDAMKQDWIDATTRLKSLTLLSAFHTQMEQWRSRSSIQDVTLVKTIHHAYVIHGRFVTVEPEQISKFVKELNDLIEQIKNSEIDDRIKKFLVRELTELRFFLEQIDLYGVEVVWTANSIAMGAVLRFQTEVSSASDRSMLLDSGKFIWRVFGWLARIGGAKEGAVLMGQAASIILGAPPAS